MTGFIIMALAAAVLWLIVRRNEAIDRLDRLDARLHMLEFDLARLRRPQSEPAEPTQQAASIAEAPTQSIPQPRATPPPIPPIPPILSELEGATTVESAIVRQAGSASEPAPAVPPLLRPQIPREHRAEPAISFESFLGVKLFAWLGGFLLFLAVAFFIKHAFDRNLITPLMRITFGYIAGVGLIVGGLFIPRKRHAVTVQTLCATGLVVLYANIFASHALFDFIAPPVAFALMAVVTAGAFVLALKLNAQVVAVLGLLGGFL